MVDVLGQLAAACGDGHARAAGPGDAVGGVPARWVAAPGDTAQVAAVLRVAAEAGLVVVPRGAGTKAGWGAPLSSVDIVLETGRLSGVAEHSPGDLVATVGAGTPLRALAAALAPAGQRLSLEVGSGDATVGGALATGEAGPLRLRHGAGRDLLIGAELVRADGVVAHSGGRVVKNVAGYDVGKLLCGSYGTLAVLTSATFRLHPLPRARAWVGRAVRSPGELRELVGGVLAATVEPVAVEVDLPGDGAGPDGLSGTVVALLEGTAGGVAKRAAATQELLGPGAWVVPEPPPWWGRYPFAAGDVALKLVAPVDDLHTALSALWDAAGAGVPVRGSAGTGVVFAALPGATGPDRLSAILDPVRSVLAARGGSCVVLAAPPSLASEVDLWGPVPGLELMRRVKEQFDPERRLSPGRFVGGI
ncbi:MAG TPA: FAD-binding oxidoreductase [Micromonosporaceae bacterium]|nr:FAD-binding oxidoreductase [Micromonosporaceae bacterium]